MDADSVVGLDIGGANLKAVHSNGMVRNHPFALWKHPDALASELATIIRSLPHVDQLAITMTGELCDCFPTKRAGVEFILGAVQAAAESIRTRVWHLDGQFIDVATARREPLRVAAANWSALATFAARYLPRGTGLLVDMGSTTTDVIPILLGKPVPAGWNDTERLMHHELVYTGVRRTPVCALLGSDGAAEFFATMRDVYIVHGDLPENLDDRDTADNRPATRSASLARLARMVCADCETMPISELEALAERLACRQRDLVSNAIRFVTERFREPIPSIVIGGEGEFCVREALRGEPVATWQVVSLSERVGNEASRAACAHALMVLASESDHGLR